jgi:predicted RNase H-like HicB family nuclease
LNTDKIKIIIILEIYGMLSKEKSGPIDRRLAMKTFTAYLEWDPETKLYVGIVPGIPGAHTQAETLDELQHNLKEVLELCLEEHSGKIESFPHFVGIQQIEVAL